MKKKAIDLMRPVIEDEKVIVLSEVGSDKSRLQYESADNLDENTEPPYVIIIPGKLHFSEEDVLARD